MSRTYVCRYLLHRSELRLAGPTSTKVPGKRTLESTVGRPREDDGGRLNQTCLGVQNNIING
jgi:hypothetical protein